MVITFLVYSPFSILEIKKSNFLYGRFCELFSIVPSFLLKGYHQLWNEEISGLNYEATIDCTHFCLHDISTNGKLLNETHVDSVFNHPSLVQAFRECDIDKQDWFDRKLQGRQKLGFDLKYDNNMIVKYAKEDIFVHLKTNFPSFLNQGRQNLDSFVFDGLRSFKMMSYMTYLSFMLTRGIR